MATTPLIANPKDPWRLKAIALLELPDDASDALVLFRLAVRAAGTMEMRSTGQPDDPWRLGVCAVLNLPPDVSDAELKAASMRLMEENLGGHNGGAPLFGIGERNPLDGLESNSAADQVRRQMGFTRRQWARLG